MLSSSRTLHHILGLLLPISGVRTASLHRQVEGVEEVVVVLPYPAAVVVEVAVVQAY